MLKKCLSLVLVLVFAITAVPLVGFLEANAADWQDVLEYEKNEAGTEIIITRCDDNVSGSLEIPAVIDGLPVTSIGNYAFIECSDLTGITIPNSVTSIGHEAFWHCDSLANITLGTGLKSIDWITFYDTAFYNNESNWKNGVLYIGKYLMKADEEKVSGAYTIKAGTLCIANQAFDGCDSLTGVTIPNSVKIMGHTAFSHCDSLASVTIGTGVKSIGSFAFEKCTSLTSITIPNSVTSIDYNAFENCTSLTSITIPNSVTSIGGEAFYNTAYYKNTSNWQSNVLYIGKYLITAKTSISGAYTIKAGTLCIANKAFFGCSKLTSVTLPNSVKNIGFDMFYKCYALTTINVDAGNKNYSSTGGVLFDKAAKTLLYCPGGKAGAYTVPNSVKSIGDWAFYYCTKLTSVTIPNSVIKIGNGAFSGCTKLTSVTIPNSVTSIGYSAFYGCTSLKSITIGTGVTSIGNGAFCGCTKLTSVTIPNSVTSIGYHAFLECTSLTSIIIPKTVTKIGDFAFGYYIFSDPYFAYEDQIEGFIIYCYKNTAGETYAKEYEITHTLLSGATTLAGISLKTKPTKTSFTVGSTLNTAGLTLTAIYNNGTAKTLSSGFTCSPTKLSTIGTQKITVTYGGKTTTFTVKVVPKTPTGVKAVSASYNSIKISWTAVSGATGYAVYRATSKTGTYTSIGSVTSASFIDKKAATGTTYYYKVKAYKMVGETKYLSGYSAIVSAKAVPAVPASFTAAKASTTSVKTTWKAVTGATGYEVWMATSSGGSYSKLTTTTKTTYTKTKLTKNKTYYFKVRAYKTVGSTKVYGAFTAVKSAKPS